jgi:hypothetical protein
MKNEQRTDLNPEQVGGSIFIGDMYAEWMRTRDFRESLFKFMEPCKKEKGGFSHTCSIDISIRLEDLDQYSLLYHILP